MKKALVIFILLAFVGGGLFAQTFNWTGQFEGGIGMLARDNEPDGKVQFGTVAPDRGVDGVRAQLELNYTNADANAGALMRFRTGFSGDPAVAQGFQGQLNFLPVIHAAWGWVNLGDNVELRGGRIHDTVLNAADFHGAYFPNGWGVLSYIRPVDMFTIGLGGYVPNSLNGALNNGNNLWEDGAFNLWGGFKADLPGLMDLRAQLEYNDKATRALLFTRISAVDILPIELALRFDQLQDFGDEGVFHGSAFFHLNMIDNLGLTFSGAFSTSMNDANENPFLAFGAYVDYNMGGIVPRFEAWYVSGGSYNYGYGFQRISSVVDFGANRWSNANVDTNANADLNYINIRPSVQFRANSGAWLEIGGLFNVDIGDKPVTYSSSDDQGVTWGAWAAVRHNF